MPVTPFHVGPAVIVKAFAGRHFSLTMFALSQVVIDLEPAIRMLRGDMVIHGPTHTYAGATVIAVLCVLLGRPACNLVLRFWRPDPSSPWLNWLPVAASVPWPAAISGAFLGTYSHVVFDSIMHADMQPWAPFAQGNALLYLIPSGQLHLLCFLAGIAGIAAMYAVFRIRGRRG